MLTQRPLVNAVQVQLLTSEGPLPTAGQDDNSLVPSPQALPPGEHITWPWDWQVSLCGLGLLPHGEED